MRLLNGGVSQTAARPVRVMQYGEGNFLRAFVDYMIDIANERGVFNGGVAIVKPIDFGDLSRFHAQDNLYTVCLRGIDDGKSTQVSRIITSISQAIDPFTEQGFEDYYALAESPELEFVVSNTTEAGIVFDDTDSFVLPMPNTYPGKLVKFLHRRYTHFNGGMDKGLIILPCELIDNNGEVLRNCVFKLIALWGLDDGFGEWVSKACEFCSTLVDRIVTGYPREEAPQIWESLGYQDNLLVTGEPFALWVIEGSPRVKEAFPLDRAELPVVFTDNHKPYKERKVRILNGAHTSFCLASYLAGNDTVLESMKDADVRAFIEGSLFEEIIPTLSLPEEELRAFAKAVIERFENPFIRHELLSISLNSVSKWRARCMPSLIASALDSGKPPARLTLSLAALMAFYSDGTLDGKQLLCHRADAEYRVTDDADVLAFFAERNGAGAEALAADLINNERFFGPELKTVPGLIEQSAACYAAIKGNGMRQALRNANL